MTDMKKRFSGPIPQFSSTFQYISLFWSHFSSTHVFPVQKLHFSSIFSSTNFFQVHSSTFQYFQYIVATLSGSGNYPYFAISQMASKDLCAPLRWKMNAYCPVRYLEWAQFASHETPITYSAPISRMISLALFLNFWKGRGCLEIAFEICWRILTLEPPWLIILFRDGVQTLNRLLIPFKPLQIKLSQSFKNRLIF